MDEHVRKIIKAYFMLTKPGIIFGNAITAAGGFTLASKGHVDVWLFLATIMGLSCIIASACVFNNYIDRNIDAKMKRTRNRALVTGFISMQNAIVFAICLGLIGISILSLYIPLLAVLIAMAGFCIYVVLYSLSKHLTIHGTMIGSFAGATPPIVGYCAVTDRLDTGALILFTMVALWQMPHFFAIAMYRLDDYAAASIPVLPIKKGMYATKIHMLLYVVAFMIIASMLTFFGYTGYGYLAVAGSLGLVWIWLCLKGFKSENDKLWARTMFRFSLVIITALCITFAFH